MRLCTPMTLTPTPLPRRAGEGLIVRPAPAPPRAASSRPPRSPSARPIPPACGCGLAAGNEQHGARAEARHEDRVVAGAGSQPQRRETMARGAFFQQALQSLIAMGWLCPGQEVERGARDVRIRPPRLGCARRDRPGTPVRNAAFGCCRESPWWRRNGRAPRGELSRFRRCIQDQPRRRDSARRSRRRWT